MNAELMIVIATQAFGFPHISRLGSRFGVFDVSYRGGGKTLLIAQLH